MPVDFNALRNQGSNNMAKLQKSLEKTERSGYDDPRIWKYSRNDKNESVCVIRFLPISAADLELVEKGDVIAEDLSPVVKVLRYQFKTPAGQYFNKNSPQTFGEEDPIREWSQPKWVELKKKGKQSSEYEAGKKELIPYIPKEDYYANILVISDSSNPENNGKVFLFKFGRAIRNFIDAAAEPPFGKPPFDPFDPFEGRNFNLFLTYEKREFNGNATYVPDFKNCVWDNEGTPIAKTEQEIEEVWRKSYSLQEFMNRSNFPSYEELKADFCKAMKLDENFNPIVGTQATSLTPAVNKTAEGTIKDKVAKSVDTQTSSVKEQFEAVTAEKQSEPSSSEASISTGDEDLDALRSMLQDSTL